MKKRDLGAVIEQLVEYVKSKTCDVNSDAWVTITYREIPEILNGVSIFYAKKIFEALKSHPNIIYEIDMTARSSNKPFKFKYVTDSEESKLSKLTSSHFYYLDQGIIDYTLRQIQSNDCDYCFKVLSFINLLAKDGALENFVPIQIKDYSSILLLSDLEISGIIDLLLRTGVLVKAKSHNYYKLVFGSNVLHSVEEQAEMFEGEAAEPEQEGSTLDDDTLSGFAEIKTIENCLASLKHKLAQVERREKENQNAYEAMTRLIETNKELEETLKSLKHENHVLTNSLTKCQERFDNYASYVQGQVEVLYADLFNLIAEFFKTPPHSRDERWSAKLQKVVIDSITVAVNSIVSYTSER